MQNTFPPEYCRFDDESREFVISKPDTPRPWENRLWNNLMTIQITNHGSAKVIERDLGERFYQYNQTGNRFIYIQDTSSGELWSPGWLPVRTGLDAFETRHGINYTMITARRDGVEVEWTNTIHPTEACELIDVTITNISKSRRKLLIVPFYELGLSFRDPYFHGSPDLFRAHWNATSDLFYIKNYSRQRDGERYALAFKSNIPASGYELSLEGFLRNYGSLQNPQVIIDDNFQNSVPDRLPPVFAMRYELDLEAGESENLSMQLFSAESFAEAEERAEHLGDEGIVRESLAFHNKAADAYFGINNLESGDETLDRFVNLWTKHQLAYNMFWNREEFGIGMRDSMQDCDSYVLQDTTSCRGRILEATRHIYDDGHTVRKWSRLDLKPYFDGGIWYVNTLCKYLRETEDMGLLEIDEPFFESEERGSVLTHAKRAMDFLDNKRGPDGLCRMGFGDWNDALNGVDRKGRGQSVWTSMAYVWALRSFVELLDYLNDPDKPKYQSIMDWITELLNEKCFEGDRYIRAITDDGLPVGSRTCSEGKLFLNTQTWAMISGVADANRAEVIRKTTEQRLYTDFGPILLDPVYKEHREDIGRITSDPPGFVENGANYVHAAMFHAYGLILAGYPDQAAKVIDSVLPSNPLNPVNKSCLEPYMITNAYEGPSSIHPGRAMFPWRTGSASWLLKVVWDGFLGIYPSYRELKLEPNLPSDWADTVRACRRVRDKKIQFVYVRKGTKCDDDFDIAIRAGDSIGYDRLCEGMTIRVDNA